MFLRRIAWASFLLLAAPTADSDEWVGARSAHFTVISDDGHKTARKVALEFERFRALFQSVLRVRVDPGIPIVVFALDGEDSMRAHLPWYWEQKGRAKPAGVFFSRPDKVFVVLRADLPGPQRNDVIYHEYVHLLTSLNFRWLPLWLNEGLAEFYATADIDDDTARFGQINPVHVRFLRNVKPLPLRELLHADRFSPYYRERNRANIFYAQSAALTHFLILGDRKREGRSLERFIQLLGEGTDEGLMMEEALGDLDLLERDFKDYIRQFRFLGAKMPAKIDAGAIQGFDLSKAEASALRADFFALMDREAEATPLVEESLRLDPELSLAHEARGHLLRHAGKNQDAANSFRLASRLEPASFLAPYFEALTSYGFDGARSRREEALRKSIQLNPGFAPAHDALASQIVHQRGDLDEAFRLSLRSVQLRPDNSGYWLTLLGILEALEQPRQVAQIEADLERVSRTDPDTLQSMVRYFQDGGHPFKAEALLRGALERNPQAVRLVVQLGGMLQAQERFDDAEAVLRVGLMARPDSTLLLNNLAFMNADRGVGLEEALTLVDKALESSPANASLLDTKGWVLHRLGREDEAERLLRQALSIDESPDSLDHLGDVLLAKGEVQEAIALWKKALARGDVRQDLRNSMDEKIARAEGSPAG